MPGRCHKYDGMASENCHIDVSDGVVRRRHNGDMTDDALIQAERRREAFRSFMGKHGLNPTKVEQQAGVSRPSIHNFLSGRTLSLSAIAYEKIANTYRVEVREITGGTPGLSRNEQLDEINERLRRMSPEQREQVIRIIEVIEPAPTDTPSIELPGRVA